MLSVGKLSPEAGKRLEVFDTFDPGPCPACHRGREEKLVGDVSCRGPG